jgi:hypothetical protein
MEPGIVLRELAAMGGTGPFVSLYMNLGTDPERTHDFVRRRIERARRAVEDRRVRDDLDRVEQEAMRRAEAGAHVPDSRSSSIAIFARGPDLLRVIELPVPVDDELVVSDGPALRQLARLSTGFERALVVLVSSDQARIFEVVMGRGVEKSEDVPGAHVNSKRAARTSPGWERLHYQRQVREQIEKHLREVAERATEIVDRDRPDLVVVGGAHPAVDRFLHELPSRIRTRVVNVIALAPDAPLGDVINVALEAMRDQETRRTEDAILSTIDLAMAGGPAALGLDEVLEAARERRLMSLYQLNSFRSPGTRCRDCGAPFREEGTCGYCGGACDPVELAEALVRSAIAQDATVEMVPVSGSLERLGGAIAKLRW